MLERKQRELVALAILVAIFIAILFANGAIPAYADICEQAKDAAHKNCTTHNVAFVIFWHISKFLDESGVAITALSTVIIAFFTWRLYWSTDKLWKESKIAGETARISANAATRAADVAEKTLAITQRAYIVLAPVSE